VVPPAASLPQAQQNSATQQTDGQGWTYRPDGNGALYHSHYMCCVITETKKRFFNM
jgi:hypothetical protein